MLRIIRNVLLCYAMRIQLWPTLIDVHNYVLVLGLKLRNIIN